MNAKQLKIKAAWIAEIGEERYNEVKEDIEDDGFITLNEAHKNEKVGAILLSFTYYETYIEKRGWRAAPEEVNKINHNNGWQRVEDGLPEEDAYYRSGKFIDGKFIEAGEYGKEGVIQLAKLGHITHYMISPTLPNPIY